MKLTSRSEYALLAMVQLARNPGRFVAGQSIAASQDIPAKFLEQILLALRRARFVRSMKGQGGGYTLAKSPDKISLAEIIRLFDGALAPTESVSRYFYESTPVERERSLLKVFKEIRDYVSEKLEQTTLSDVM